MCGFIETILVCSLALASVPWVQGQNLRKGGGGGRRVINNKAQDNSFTVGYPMGILSDTDKASKDKNWRDPAVKSQELYDLSENGKPYAFLAKAQDQEDIWLYENWFYGLKGTTIEIIICKYILINAPITIFLFRGCDYGVWSP